MAKKKAAKAKVAPKKSATLASTAKADDAKEMSPPSGLAVAVHGVIRVAQDGKLAILGVLRAEKRPMTLPEIQGGLEKIGLDLDPDLIEIHLLFLINPSVNLARIVPGTDPHQYEAVAVASA